MIFTTDRTKIIMIQALLCSLSVACFAAGFYSARTGKVTNAILWLVGGCIFACAPRFLKAKSNKGRGRRQTTTRGRAKKAAMRKKETSICDAAETEATEKEAKAANWWTWIVKTFTWRTSAREKQPTGKTSSWVAITEMERQYQLAKGVGFCVAFWFVILTIQQLLSWCKGVFKVMLILFVSIVTIATFAFDNNRTQDPQGCNEHDLETVRSNEFIDLNSRQKKSVEKMEQESSKKDATIARLTSERDSYISQCETLRNENDFLSNKVASVGDMIEGLTKFGDDMLKDSKQMVGYVENEEAILTRGEAKTEYEYQCV